MQQQGTAATNPDFITNLTEQINGISICSELQELSDEVMQEIKFQLSGINLELDKLLPIHALLSPPTDLGSILSWINNLISSVITPLYKPYLTYIQQLTSLASELSTLVSAIEAAAARIGSCSISMDVPTITIPTAPS